MRQVKKKLIAFTVALCIAVAYFGAVHDGGIALARRGRSLGLSDADGGGLGESSQLGDSGGGGDRPSLGDSAIPASADEAVYSVRTYKELADRLKNTGTATITIYLEDNIYMEGFIEIPSKKTVTIDGRGRFGIDEVSKDLWNLRAKEGTSVTLRNMEIQGRSIYGIVYGIGTYSTAVFDSIVYRGPQLVFMGLEGCRAITQGKSEVYIRDYGVSAEEVFQVPQIYLGGELYIEHLYGVEDVNYINDAVFFTEGAGPQKLVVEDGANIKVKSGSYLFYAGAGSASVHIGRDAVLDVEACGGLGHAGDAEPSHYFSSFFIDEGGRFSYKQRESTRVGNLRPSKHHFQGYARNLSVRNKGTFRMEPGSVFEYDTEYNKYQHGGSGGFFLRNSTVVLNQPKLFSIRNPGGAMHTNGNGVLSSWETSSWQITGINAANIWTAGDASSDADRAANIPDYVWNPLLYDAGGRPHSIGGPFALAIDKNGAISGSSLTDIFGGGAALDAMNLKNTAVKRFAVGYIDPFTVDPVRGVDPGIAGALGDGDLMAAYRAGDKTATLTGETDEARQRYLLEYGDGPLPTGRTPVTVVANSRGLRAAIHRESEGELLIRSVPVLDYGTQKLPGKTTVYYRDGTAEGDADAQPDEALAAMQVVVEDTRGPDADSWTLTVKRGAFPQEWDAARDLPEGALIFRDRDGAEWTLDTHTAVPAWHEVQAAATEPVVTVAEWGRETGILVKAVPGRVDTVAYRSVIEWSFLSAP